MVDMKLWLIIAIVAVLLILAVVIIIFMRKKAKKDPYANLKESSNWVNKNYKSIGELFIMARDNENVTNKLKELQGHLHFLISSNKEEVNKIDKEINSTIGELKIELNGKNNEQKIIKLIDRAESLIAERNIITSQQIYRN